MEIRDKLIFPNLDLYLDMFNALLENVKLTQQKWAQKEFLALMDLPQ